MITAWSGRSRPVSADRLQSCCLRQKAQSFATTGAQRYAQAQHLTDEGS